MSQGRPTPTEIEAYARAFVTGGKKAPAFRVAFPDSKAKQDNTHKLASKFSKLIEVQSRVGELQAEAKKKAEKTDEPFTFSFEAKVRYLVGIMADAKHSGKLSAGVAACKELNLMLGDHAAIKHQIGGDDTAPIRVEVKEDFFYQPQAPE